MNILRMLPKPNTFLLFLILLLFGAAPAQAQTTAGLSLHIEAGYDGWYKSAYWLPVHISAANSGPAIDGELRLVIQDGPNNQTIYTTPLELPTQSDKRVTIPVKASRNLTSLEVTLVADGRSLGSATTRTGGLRALPTNTLLYGIVTPDVGSFDFLANVTGRRGETAVSYLSLHHLPETPPVWNSLDILILHNTDSGQLSPAQRQALTGWIQSGGQLVVIGGPDWQLTSGGLGDWLPVTPHTVENVDSLPILSQQTGIPLEQPGPYLVTNSTLRQGELLWHQDGLPLLARRDWGQGAVYFLALDPTLAPLRGWDGQAFLWQTIAGTVADITLGRTGVQNSNAAITAVSSLAQRALPNAAILMLFMCIYILLIGPINYKLLKRRGQRELAWLTIPVLVLIFSGIAYATGFGLRGSAPIINQISIVTGQSGNEQVRAQTIIGLYSPARANYDLTLPTSVTVNPLARSFSAAPSGSGHIIRDTSLTITDIRTDIGSVETFLADSYQPAPDLTASATLYISGGVAQLEVTVINNGRFPLEYATLVSQNQIEAIGTIPAGGNHTATISLDTTVGTTFIPSSSFGPPQALLMSNANTIFGGWDFHSNPDTFSKYQLLEAISAAHRHDEPMPTIPLTLLGWSEDPQLTVELSNNRTEHLASTLYLLTIPIQTVDVSEQLTIPPSLLHWTPLNYSQVYQPTIVDLYLNSGWIEFEFTPWSTFQDVPVASLDIFMRQQAGNAPAPALLLWDWAEGEWVSETAVDWGTSTITNHQRYLSQNNSLRLRLEDQAAGTNVNLIYPQLTIQPTGGR